MKHHLPRRYVARYFMRGPNGNRLIRKQTIWAFSYDAACRRAFKNRSPGWTVENVRQMRTLKDGNRLHVVARTNVNVGACLLVLGITAGISAPVIVRPVEDHIHVTFERVPRTHEEDDPGWNCQTQGNHYCGKLGQERQE